MTELLMRQKIERRVKNINKTNIKLIMKAKRFQSRNKKCMGDVSKKKIEIDET